MIRNDIIAIFKVASVHQGQEPSVLLGQTPRTNFRLAHQDEGLYYIPLVLFVASINIFIRQLVITLNTTPKDQQTISCVQLHNANPFFRFRTLQLIADFTSNCKTTKQNRRPCASKTSKCIFGLNKRTYFERANEQAGQSHQCFCN